MNTNAAPAPVAPLEAPENHLQPQHPPVVVQAPPPLTAADIRVRLEQEQAALLVAAQLELTAPHDITAAQRNALKRAVTARNDAIEHLRRILSSLAPLVAPTAAHTPTAGLDTREQIAKRALILRVSDKLGPFKTGKDKTPPTQFWDSFTKLVTFNHFNLEDAKELLDLSLQKHPHGRTWFENNVRKVVFPDITALKSCFYANYLSQDWKTTVFRKLTIMQFRLKDTVKIFTDRF